MTSQWLQYRQDSTVEIKLHYHHLQVDCTVILCLWCCIDGMVLWRNNCNTINVNTLVYCNCSATVLLTRYKIVQDCVLQFYLYGRKSRQPITGGVVLPNGQKLFPDAPQLFVFELLYSMSVVNESPTFSGMITWLFTVGCIFWAGETRNAGCTLCPRPTGRMLAPRFTLWNQSRLRGTGQCWLVSRQLYFTFVTKFGGKTNKQ